MPGKAIRVFALLFCLVSPAHQAYAQVKAGPASVIARIRKMRAVVVQIRYSSNAPNPQPRTVPFDVGARAGTGFFVSPTGYVLTAGHVIRSSEKAAREKGATNIVFRVGILLDTSSTSSIHFSGSFAWVNATVVDVDEIHDLALLKVSQNPFT